MALLCSPEEVLSPRGPDSQVGLIDNGQVEVWEDAGRLLRREGEDELANHLQGEHTKLLSHLNGLARLDMLLQLLAQAVNGSLCNGLQASKREEGVGWEQERGGGGGRERTVMQSK